MQNVDFTNIEHVTVVAPDNLIIVNRVALNFEFPHADNLHAIQWDGISKTGHVEYTDAPNKEIGASQYKKEVLPFVQTFQAEYNRQQQAEQEAQAEAERQYNSEESRFERLRNARDRKLAETDYLLAADYPITTDKLELVRAYRQALRDLPSHPDAPWDGGGEATPWPDKAW